MPKAGAPRRALFGSRAGPVAACQPLRRLASPDAVTRRFGTTVDPVRHDAGIVGGRAIAASWSGPQQEGIVLRPGSWVLSSRENRATGGSPEHVTLVTSRATKRLRWRSSSATETAPPWRTDVIRRFLKPAHDPAIVDSQRRAYGSPGFRLRVWGALAQLRGELAWADEPNKRNRGRRYAAVWLRLGTWDAAWSRRSALRFGHSRPGRARS
jgi:hypothetical protein